MPGSWVEQKAFGIVLYIFAQLAGDWSNQAWEWFAKFFAAPVAVLDDPLVQRLVQVAVGLVLGFLPVAIAWLVLRETLARMDGASTTSPATLVRRALITGVAVTGTSLLAWFMVTLANHARDMLVAVGLDLTPMQRFFDAPLTTGSIILGLQLMFLVAAIILSLQRWVIAAEFTVLMVMGPVMAAGLINEGGQSTFSIWLREVISLLITPLIQMMVLLIFLRKWGEPGLLGVEDRLASLAFLWVLWNTPRWARQMVYSAGAGSAVVGTAANVGRLMIMRQLIRGVTKV